MKSKISKWGNSYAVRLPIELIEELGLEEESTLEIRKTKNSITLKKPSKEQQLQLLLNKLSPQKEIDWGTARGKEAW